MLTPDQLNQVKSIASNPGGVNPNTPIQDDASYDAWKASVIAPKKPSQPVTVPDVITPVAHQVGSDIGSIVDSFKKNATDVSTGQKPSLGQEIATGADLAGKITSVPVNAVGAAAGAFVPHQIKEAAGTALKDTADAVTSNPEALQALNTINDLVDKHPELAKLIGGLGTTAFNVGGLDTGGEAAGVAKNVATSAVEKTVPAVVDAAKAAGGFAKDAPSYVVNAAKTGGQAAIDRTPFLNESGLASTQRTISNRAKELQKIEDNNATIRKVVQAAKAKGIDVKDIVANTDLLHGSVDKTGTIRTTGDGGAVEQLNDFIRPQENVISKLLAKEGKVIPLSQLENDLTSAVNKSSVKGGAKIRALNSAKQDIEGYKLDAIDANGKPWVEGKSKGEPMIPVSTIHDAKVDKYANIDYTNPESSKTDKIIAKTLKQTVEKNTKSADVEKLNKELSRHYATLNFLEKLDGKKVEGGKMGKYFAQLVGATVGSHFGPLGGIVGAEAGGAIKGAQMARKLSGKTGQVLEQSPAMKRAIKMTSKKGESVVE